MYLHPCTNVYLLEIIGESWLGLLGADSLGISSDFTRPLPAAISPRLLIGLRKTGYLDLSTGPGDSVRDISGHIRIGFRCRFCGTSAGHPCGTRFRANLKPPKPIFFLRDGTVTFYKNTIESCWTSILKILTKSILQEKSHFRAAGHFPKLSRFRTEIMSRNVPQQHFVP